MFKRVKNPKNGIQMDIWSNQNGAQFYTSNFLNLTKPSTGQKYAIHEGFCIETSNYPDAINKVSLFHKKKTYAKLKIFIISIFSQPLFPSSVLRPEGKYNHRTIYQFRIQN